MLDAATLTWRGSFGSCGTAPGQLMNPVGLTVIGTELYVRDTKNHRIQVFDVSGAAGAGICGAFLRSFGEYGDGPGCFMEPTGMAHDGRGRLIVSEAGSCRVQVLTMNGEPLQVLPLPLAGRLYGICESAGKLYIADYAKHLIHVLEFKEERLPPTPPRTPHDKLS
uniref:Peptidylamidoglycolate lyase n=1 Tax=Haptolina brevifila TaxID=156173 RepID=A0A7S2JAS9_9EUKA|mmetsp:Transcript_79428/g.157911  ORF Transcript_79428/g.157911 Transcript_79428/m.157911 type:complete len:166 (+) Transcript_79428:3-500(+)